MSKPIVPGSRDFIAEARRADLEKADAERAAARAMLAALKYADQLYRDGILNQNDDPWVGTLKQKLDAAIAAAEAAGIKSEG